MEEKKTLKEVEPMAPPLLQLLRRVALKYQAHQRELKQWRIGLTLVQPKTVNISQCIEREVLMPLVKYLSECSGKEIRLAKTASPLVFSLRVQSKNFALFRMTNPANARAFVQFWIEKGCCYGGMVELHSVKPLVAALLSKPE